MVNLYRDKDALTLSDAEKFWRRVAVGERHECWPYMWERQRKRKGKPNPSPRILWNGKYQQAHRVAWELRHGAVPEGMKVRRTCRNLYCVNPGHMEIAKGGKPHYLNPKQQREVLHLWRTTQLPAWQIGERFGVGVDVINELIRREL